ncbi:MAG: Asp-tRNA(Asn)/Glu-tRNA(Gln) amidotransferase subunit GatC [bacterium]|nr:Asp-tRNA(Asn)/Glu-tRNA(Gln) amidotransferase subunit GatC [bacterium]
MISKEEVLNLAELARLKLSDTEVTSLQKDISNILEYVGQLRRPEVGAPTEASGVSIPLLRNVMRDDVPRSADDLLAGKEEKLRSAFPKREGQYNVVRKIIQKDE